MQEHQRKDSVTQTTHVTKQLNIKANKAIQGHTVSKIEPYLQFKLDLTIETFNKPTNQPTNTTTKHQAINNDAVALVQCRIMSNQANRNTEKIQFNNFFGNYNSCGCEFLLTTILVGVNFCLLRFLWV